MTAPPEEREPPLEAARHLLAVNRPGLAEREVRHWHSRDPRSLDGVGLLRPALLMDVQRIGYALALRFSAVPPGVRITSRGMRARGG